MKILYLVNRKYYLKKMSRVRFHGLKALQKLADIHYSGVGWSDFDNKVSVQENINNMNTKFDIVIVYKPLEMRDFKSINLPKCIRYNEMWDIEWTTKEIIESGANLVICHHLNEMKMYNTKTFKAVVHFVYIGHCAEKSIFKNYNYSKKYDLVLVGNLSRRGYPLRYRFHNIFKKLSSKYRCHIHKHPGYDLNDAYTDRYLIEFAKIINRSKIAITDSGVPRTRYGKYIEIPMCHTALAGNIPLDDADDYDYIIRLNNEMTDKEIINKLIYYLKNEDKREEKVRKGIEFVKNYTQEHYARRLFDEIERFLKYKITV